jgi:membrane-associated phospholipid phosphatase
LGFALVALTRNMGFVAALDERFYILAMRLSYTNAWIRFWEIVTFFGDGFFAYPLLIFFTGVFFYHFRGKRAAAYVTLMMLCFLINPILKLFFRLERPVSLSPYTELLTYTFPSGHAFNSVIIFYFLPRFAAFIFHDKNFDVVRSRLFALVGIYVIGMSRIILGAHWFSDVCGGWLLGGATATLLAMLLQHMEKDRVLKHDEDAHKY